MMHDRDVMHAYYTAKDRHFDPQSEAYTGADSLLTALRRGWDLVGPAMREDILLGGGRHTTVYHFNLQYGIHKMMMSVVSNPYLVRFLVDMELRVHHLPDDAIAIELEALLA